MLFVVETVAGIEVAVSAGEVRVGGVAVGVESEASDARVTTVSEESFDVSVGGLCGNSMRFADGGLVRAGESVLR